MDDYKEKIQKLFEFNSDFIEFDSKLEFIGSIIFDFTTYDGAIDELLAIEMLNVIDAMLNGKTFEYIEQEDKYLTYIIMLNMPFMRGKISYGASIRGAFFDTNGDISIDSDRLIIKDGEIKEFMIALLEWARE